MHPSTDPTRRGEHTLVEWSGKRHGNTNTNEQGEPESAGAFFDDIVVTALSGVEIDAGISDLVFGYPQTAGLPVNIAPTVSNFGVVDQTIGLWYLIDDGAGVPVPPYLDIPALTDSLVIFDGLIQYCR